jgi:O-acetyl-ADP-ribose deacetylase (regulator of RNase III)
VITGAHNLPNDYVIHCLGPVYGKDTPSDELLANCYRNALEIAEDKGIKSIAFPSISTGAFGYPKKEATEVALNAVKEKADDLNKVQLIRFVLFGEEDLDLFEDKLEEMK